MMAQAVWPSLAGGWLASTFSWPMLRAGLVEHPWACALIAGLLGACLGSFINVLGMRWPAALMAAWRREARAILGLSEPGGETAGAAGGTQAGGVTYQENLCNASRCPHCQHRIRWHDNVPVLGWLFLRGRCRDCRAGISPIYPVVEALGALGCAGMLLLLGPSLAGLAGCILWLLALALSLIDLRTLLLPDGLVYTLLWLGLLGALVGIHGFPTPGQAIAGAASGYAGLWLIGNGHAALRGFDGLGGGDVKLYAAAGAWCGLAGLIPVLVVATGCGLVLGVTRLAFGKRGAFPFGPAILAGIIIQWVFPHWMQPILDGLAR